MKLEHAATTPGPEWLLANGRGGYAMGDQNGKCTRTRHHLLVAVTRPPLQRVAFIRDLHETMQTPAGWREIAWTHFEHDRQVLRFTCKHETVTLVRTVWLAPTFHGVWVRYDLSGSHTPLPLRIVPLLEFLDLETQTPLCDHYSVRRTPAGALVFAQPHDTPLRLEAAPAAHYVPLNIWHDLLLYNELEEPQRHTVYLPFAFEYEVTTPAGLTLLLAYNGPDSWVADAAWQQACETSLVAGEKERVLALPPGLRQLALSARAFVIQRPTMLSLDNTTVLAGYPDFADGGREAMIALPGVLLVTGRFESARQVFRLFLKHVSQGLIPGHFSRRPASPTYDSLDATLWMFVALYEYWQARGDPGFLEENYSLLLEILNCHLRNSAPGVRCDPATGFLHAPDAQRVMTWMNRRVGEWCATPRPGFAVEVQALWHHALCFMAEISRLLGKGAGEQKCRELAAQVAASLVENFWHAGKNCCFDTIPEIGRRSPHSPPVRAGDAAVRPNQVIAAGLPYTAFSTGQTRAVVELALAKLVTPYGLRTLAPDHPAYCGRCTGSEKQRASAVHNGTVHPWLIVPFVTAYLRVCDDQEFLRRTFAPLFAAQNFACDGFVAEMYDGDAPHTPRGAPAYAASSGAVLQAWHLLLK
ncbi:MAG: amylo-alpha-1,6-glucosidase [candidate division KSB1 bacterium]|nr:amylo-alpha-1,6-glucosidase [candidate division KSB1 bacterium]MDZ7274818.1 amylo-alpha-1,6-glucosidase [candidate division KSB1 bacterium]MDZ7285643.1 amylo-alpha-1,6-glucosidase [candidate division KSB1 bacterium]MDZ7298675.1 amylo-alpha-1,6-glucosidase [candidate division KSB1 bacterium]MDZ7308786.1 amylo-alpha-1,6-glucosidase [candidate division KSB1 bacterium]